MRLHLVAHVREQLTKGSNWTDDSRRRIDALDPEDANAKQVILINRGREIRKERSRLLFATYSTCSRQERTANGHSSHPRSLHSIDSRSSSSTVTLKHPTITTQASTNHYHFHSITHHKTLVRFNMSQQQQRRHSKLASATYSEPPPLTQ